MRDLALPLCLAALVVLAGCSGAGGSGGANGGGSIGLAAGGAQDVNAYRANIDEGNVPQPTDLTYEGLFHDYYFDTGRQRRCDRLFCPSYSRAVTRDPLSDETEYYTTVGLNSGLSKAEFERRKLDLVVVVDTSDSMSSSFREYYYDDGEHEESAGTRKMRAAREAVATLTTHLDEGDRLGVVAFDDRARTVQPLSPVGETDMARVRDRIGALRADGGTNLAAGMDRATRMLRPYRDADRSEYETRIVVVTDAMPNLGDTSTEGLGGQLRENAEHGVYSTFVGVGVDFNSKLVERINDVRGANYYAVHSTREFRERMDEGFDYMVTPLVFDLSVAVEAEGWRVERVYGSPDAAASTGRMLHVDTLFPSRRTDNRTEGGVVLAELERTGGTAGPVTLTATYETRTGERVRTTRTVRFDDRAPPYYGSTGVRKAVALVRYADLMRNWMAYERARAGRGSPDEPPEGIESRELGRWEQRSVPLRVSPTYRERIERFEPYFAREMRALNASRMERDLAILRSLTGHGATATAGTDPSATATAGERADAG